MLLDFRPVNEGGGTAASLVHGVETARLGGLDGVDQEVGVVGLEQVGLVGFQVAAQAFAVAVGAVAALVDRAVPVEAQAQFMEGGVVGIAVGVGEGAGAESDLLV